MSKANRKATRIVEDAKIAKLIAKAHQETDNRNLKVVNRVGIPINKQVKGR